MYSQGQNYVILKKICGKSFSKSILQGQNYVLLNVRAIYFALFLKVRTMYLKVKTMYFSCLVPEEADSLFAF